MDTAVCKELIVTTIARRGTGTPHSPIRIVTQVFEKDGTLVAEKDQFNQSLPIDSFIDFARWCMDKGVYSLDKINDVHIKQWLLEK